MELHTEMQQLHKRLSFQNKRLKNSLLWISSGEVFVACISGRDTVEAGYKGIFYKCFRLIRVLIADRIFSHQNRCLLRVSSL